MSGLLAERRGVTAKPTAATYAQTVLATSGLISYWRLNEPSGTVAADQMAANAGTYVSLPTLDQAGATTDGDKAVLLGTAYVKLKSGPILAALPNSTMQMWVKLSGIPSQYPTLYCERPGSGNDVYYRLYLNASGEAADVRGRVSFQHRDDAGFADQFIPAGGTQITDNAWHQVVIVKAGTALRIYVDEALEPGSPFTITGNDTLTTAGIETRVGSDVSDPSVFLGGQVAALVDDISVYNVALSAGTIAAHYAAR